MSLRVTGKLPSGKLLEKIKQSPNHNGRGFKNLSPTPMMTSDATYWKMTRQFFKRNPGKEPKKKLPSVKTDLDKLHSIKPIIVWFGHSSYFIKIADKNFLIDPVFSGNAAPVSFMVKAFPGSNVYQADDMPVIDYLVLTHDHYDHLDYKTIRRLKSKVKTVYCSLGVSSHLRYWGYDDTIITELDWWQSADFDDRFKLTAAPARHFSGRGLKRNQTLWSSFILQSPGHKLFLGGDSGYDEYFKDIGKKHGPFDLVILEAGQYNVMWPYIHMMPEETVRATIDLGAKVLLPVHWGKFSLSLHAWDEPIRRVVAESSLLHVSVVAPKIGQPLVLDGSFQTENWWELL